MFISFLSSWIPEKLNETPTSPCSGEPMPVVVRNFQILSSIISFGAVPALFVLALAGVPEVQARAAPSCERQLFCEDVFTYPVVSEVSELPYQFGA